MSLSPTRNISAKMEPDAWDSVKKLAAKYDIRISDVLSICVDHHGEEARWQMLERGKLLAGTSKAVRSVLSMAESLTPEEKAELLKAIQS